METDIMAEILGVSGLGFADASNDGCGWNNQVARNRIKEAIEKVGQPSDFTSLRKIAEKSLRVDIRSYIQEKRRVAAFLVEYQINDLGLQIIGGGMDGQSFHDFIVRSRELGPKFGQNPDEAELTQLEKIELAFLKGADRIVSVAGRNGAYRYLQVWERQGNKVKMTSTDMAINKPDLKAEDGEKMVEAYCKRQHYQIVSRDKLLRVTKAKPSTDRIKPVFDKPIKAHYRVLESERIRSSIDIINKIHPVEANGRKQLDEKPLLPIKDRVNKEKSKDMSIVSKTMKILIVMREAKQLISAKIKSVKKILLRKSFSEIAKSLKYILPIIKEKLKIKRKSAILSKTGLIKDKLERIFKLFKYEFVKIKHKLGNKIPRDIKEKTPKIYKVIDVKKAEQHPFPKKFNISEFLIKWETTVKNRIVRRKINNIDKKLSQPQAFNIKRLKESHKSYRQNKKNILSEVNQFIKKRFSTIVKHKLRVFEKLNQITIVARRKLSCLRQIYYKTDFLRINLPVKTLIVNKTNSFWEKAVNHKKAFFLWWIWLIKRLPWVWERPAGVVFKQPQMTANIPNKRPVKSRVIYNYRNKLFSGFVLVTD